jgi:hypothetical protein
MAALASPLFFRGGQSNDDEQQLLKLFWSRATLKKQFDRLRDENFELSERLKHEEMLKLRLQQKFEQLESMLANPATAATAITYYQLKNLWHQCNLRLTAISKELWTTHYEVENRKHVAKFRRELYKSLSAIQRDLHGVNHQGDALSEQIRALRELRSKRQGFWNFFRRRQLTAEINLKRIQRRAITMRLGELTEESQACSNAPPPQFCGLETATRRSINLTVIACAQELYLHFADRELAVMARESSIRQVTDVHYGDSQVCREISRYLEERAALLQADTEWQSRAQMRAGFLSATTAYNRQEDTLPNADSVASIQVLTANGKSCGRVDVNVLADEYWDVLAAVLI